MGQGTPRRWEIESFEMIRVVLLASFIIGLSASASMGADTFNRIEFPSSPNPVGSGARALGMGGAFIAVADDATAASWNPGGLIQLERPEISIVYEAFHRIEDLSTGDAGPQTVGRGGINYLSAAFPFQLFERNMIVSLNYQRLFDFTRRWRFPLETETEPLRVQQTIDHSQSGELSALGLAYCIQITPSLSAGLTLNLWDDDLTPNEWESETVQNGEGSDRGEPFAFKSISRDVYSLQGLNANLGMMYRIGGRLTLGAVYKLPFSADLDHTRTHFDEQTYPDLPKFGIQRNDIGFSSSETLEMPASYGIGLAYRFWHNLMISADLYRTEWGDSEYINSEGRSTSLLTGKQSDIDPTHQIRIGGEYLIITPNLIIPLTAGLFYDPMPSAGSPDDIFGLAFGSGIGYGSFHLDIAYQWRHGDGIELFKLNNEPFLQDLDEHTVYASMVYHF